MEILLGLAVALTYGTGDFFGGLATKKTPATAVVVGSMAIASLLLVVGTVGWAIVGTPSAPAAPYIWLGVATGLVGPIALGLLYQGLAMGRMSVVAPTTAVVAAIVPLCWGLAQGERPSAVALAGVAVALVSVALISSAPTHEDHPDDAAAASLSRVIPMAVGSGLGFGVVYVLLGSTTDDAAIWPLTVARPVAVVATLTATVLATRHRRADLRPAVVAPPDARALVAGAGILDISANAIYLAATRIGPLSIVAVLSSLYPAATVVLARVVLGERLHRLQIGGLVLAAIGVAAMAAG